MSRPLPVPWRSSADPDRKRDEKKLDPFTLLEHLANAKRKDVREHCVKNLDNLGGDEIDFFLPQICSLLMSMEWKDSHSLRLFVLRKCMESLHLALKTYWFLHASSDYCSPEKFKKCQKLWQQVETAAVNNALPRSALDNDDPGSPKRVPAPGLSTPPNPLPKPPSHSRTPTPNRPPPPKRAAPASGSKSGSAASGRSSRSPEAVSLDETQPMLRTPQPAKAPTNPSAPASSSVSRVVSDPEINILTLSPEVQTTSAQPGSSAKPASAKPGGESAPLLATPSADPVDAPLSADPPAPAANSSSAEKKEAARIRKLGREESRHHLLKQRRCTYFNAQLDLVHFLEGVSESLKNHKPGYRKEVLIKNLHHANGILPRGLYFPCNLRASDPHLSLLRIIPESCIVLDSKDKVPFLLHCEIRRNSYPTFSNRVCDQLEELSNTLPNAAIPYPLPELKSDDDGKRPLLVQIPSSGATKATDGPSPRHSRGQDSPVAQIEAKKAARDADIGKKLKAIVKSEKKKRPPAKNRAKVKSSTKRKAYTRGWKRKIKSPFPPDWETVTVPKYREASNFAEREGDKWGTQAIIFKAGDDLRQEAMAMQLICLFESIFEESRIPIKLLPYTLQVTSPSSGFVEVIPNSISISSLKHKVTGFTSLSAFFEDYFGPRGSKPHKKAVNNFVESLAGWSLVCYLLQIKDRHNGNIMIDSSGRLIHIDYGFMLSSSPGGNIGFETSPFKFQEDFITLLGGEEQESEHYAYFQLLMIRGFLESRKHVRKFVTLVEIMYRGSTMECFQLGQQAIDDLRERFLPNASHDQVITRVMQLIEESSCNWRTAQYDNLQRITNDIL